MVKVLLINLDRSPDRLEGAQRQLAAVDLPWERVPAVDGRQLSRAEIDRNYSRQRNRRVGRLPLTRGEIGCYLSHLACWRKIVDEGLEAAVVMEDDCCITGDLADVARRILRSGVPCDYVKLDRAGSPRARAVADLGDGWRLVRPFVVPASATIQLVTRAGAEKLIAAARAFARPVDVDMKYWWENGLEILCLSPPVVDLGAALSGSHLGGARAALKARIRRRAPLQYALRRLWLQADFHLHNLWHQRERAG